MTDLEEIQEYILNDLRMSANITESRIKKLYDIIPNIEMRVNDDDKKYVACVTEDYENSTVFKAIQILIKDELKKTVSKLVLIDAIKEVCRRFQKLKINNKPRIPFYILVLDKVFSK